MNTKVIFAEMNARPKIFRPVRNLNPCPLQYRCNALPTELTSQLVARIFEAVFSPLLKQCSIPVKIAFIFISDSSVDYSCLLYVYLKAENKQKSEHFKLLFIVVLLRLLQRVTRIRKDRFANIKLLVCEFTFFFIKKKKLCGSVQNSMLLAPIRSPHKGMYLVLIRSPHQGMYLAPIISQHLNIMH